MFSKKKLTLVGLMFSTLVLSLIFIKEWYALPFGNSLMIASLFLLLISGQHTKPKLMLTTMLVVILFVFLTFFLANFYLLIQANE